MYCEGVDEVGVGVDGGICGGGGGDDGGNGGGGGDYIGGIGWQERNRYTQF